MAKTYTVSYWTEPLAGTKVMLTIGQLYLYKRPVYWAKGATKEVVEAVLKKYCEARNVVIKEVKSET